MFSGKKKNARRAVYDRTPFRARLWRLPLLALGLTLLIEVLSRKGLPGALNFAFTRPLFFLFNVLIVLTSLSFSEIFRRRRSVLLLVSAMWIGLGVAQFMVVRERTQPFSSMDVFAIKDAITLTTIYYTWPQIILMYGSIFLAVIFVVWLFLRLPRKRHVNYRRSVPVFAGLVLLCMCIQSLGLRYEVFPRHYDNLISAYNDYGFAFCFTATFGSMGVAKPSEYSTESVAEIVEAADVPLEETVVETSPEPDGFSEEDIARPNVIYVQLESFFDPTTVVGAAFDGEPTPNFHRLCQGFPSGELYVPSVGGGTANTEFEMLSGMNLDFFGTGEYPYNTILQQTTCETIAYDLLELGYCTTAMHNHNGKFYSRNTVYPRLGFKHFVPVEYMPYVTYTPIGWSEDSILTGEILKAMTASESRDFVFCITVESHGKYDDNYVYTPGDPAVLSLPEAIPQGRFLSWLHLVHECDKFVGSLVDEMSRWPEPVIVVFYGDHLPAMELTNELLTTGNVYASRYVIWNNFGGSFEAPDQQAYQVSPCLLKQLGITGGVITRFHQNTPADDEHFLDSLEMLEYDLLYGDQTAYEDGINPYEPVDMMMGTLPIEITAVSDLYGRVLVTGANFTESSMILIDGVSYPTAFVSDEQIVAIVPRTTTVGQVEVAQLTSDGTELGRTEPFTLRAPGSV